MHQDTVMRRALGISVIYNLAADYLFAFPSSTPGHLAGLPPAIPALYRMLLVFVALFGGAHAWLARQPDMDRPLVAFSASDSSALFPPFLAEPQSSRLRSWLRADAGITMRLLTRVEVLSALAGRKTPAGWPEANRKLIGVTIERAG